MGNWENTTYIEHGSARLVADAIAALLRLEGMQHVPRPAPRLPERFDPVQYAGAMENNLWGVAVFPGSPGWTVVKTAPFELLGERAPGASRMRVIELAGRLGAAGCQVNLYDGSSVVLIEVDRQGRYLLSGYCTLSDGADPLSFHEEQISEDRVDVRFELLPLRQLVEESIRDLGNGPWRDDDELVMRLADTLGGDNAASCDNITSAHLLLSHLPLTMPGGIDLYFEWPARDRRAELLESLKAARPKLFA
jgi:hypothetical protein